jgi:hypothetical protein
MWRKVKTVPVQPNVSFSSNVLAYFAVASQRCAAGVSRSVCLV